MQQKQQPPPHQQLTKLKYDSTRLTKDWIPHTSIEPFQGEQIEYNADGTRGVSLLNGNILIWNWPNVTPAVKLIDEELTEDYNETITCFTLLSHGNKLCTASSNFLLRYWDIEGDQRKCIRSMKGHSMPILSMASDYSGTLVATGSADNIVRVWDVEKGYCTHIFKYHRGIVQYVTFNTLLQSHDGNNLQLISAADDYTLNVYNLHTNKIQASFNQHMGTVTSTSFGNDGKLLVTAGRDKVFNVYDVEKFKHLKTVAVMEDLEGIVCVDNPFHHEQNEYLVIVGGKLGILKFYTISIHQNASCTVECIKEVIVGHSYQLPHDAALDANNTSQQAVLRAITHLTLIRSTNELIVATANRTLYSYSFRTDNPGLVEERRHVVGAIGDVLDLAIIPGTQAERFVVISNSTSIQVMDKNCTTNTLYGHADIVLSLDISNDGKYAVTTSKDKSCRVWDLESYQCLGVAEGHTEAVGAACIAKRESTYLSKNAFIISGSSDKIIKRWSLTKCLHNNNNGEVIKLKSTHSTRAHEKDINSLATSPNDSMVASGSHDSTIKLWDVTDLSLLATLTGHRKGVWKVCFSPVDKILASGSGDRTIKLWSLTEYNCIRTMQGSTASVLSLRFINHGLQIISSASDGLIRLWTVATGECNNTFDHHNDRVWAVAYDSDAATLMSAGSDGKIIQWKDNTEAAEREKIEQAENNLLMEQSLSNHLRNNNYAEALQTALKLKNSSKVLTIFNKINETSASNYTEIAYWREEAQRESRLVERLDKLTSERGNVFDNFVSTWDEETMNQVLEYIKEWNCYAKNMFIAQALFNSILRVLKPAKLLEMKSFNTYLPSLIAYTDKHFQRLDKIHEALYLLDYVSGQSSLQPVKELEDLKRKKQPQKQVPVIFETTEIAKKRKLIS